MRVVTLTAALVALLAAPPAQAAVGSSAVTRPGGTTYTAPFDNTFGAPAETIDVAGTSAGGAAGDKVDVRCYSGPGAADYDTLAAGVAVGGDGRWDTGAVSLGPLAGSTCTLRAVPAGTNPGALGSFSGPTLAVDTIEHVSAGPVPVDDRFTGTQQSGRFHYSSAGHCGVESSEVLGGAFLPTAPLFDCGAAFYLSDNLANDLTNNLPSTDSDRSEIRIDRHDAYAPYQASIAWNNGSSSSASNSGLPSVRVEPQVDGADGDVALHEVEQIVKCPDAAAGSTNYPPSSSNCSKFVPANVRLDRFITQSRDGTQTTVTDDWSSADGRAHTLDVLYDQGVAEAADYGAGPGYRMPGETGFAGHGTGDALPDGLPAIGSLFLEPRRDLPDGDPANPQGAISWDTPASAGVFTNSDEFFMGYVLGIPAGGAVVMRFVYSQATIAAGAARLATAAERALGVPAVVPAAPGGGPTIPGIKALLHTTPSGIGRCRVPRLKGLTRTAARRKLRRAGCRLFRTRHARSRVRKGRVVRSHPRAGALRRRGAPVSIYVSTGRRRRHHH